MSEPFLAEIRIFGFNFPPRGWAACDGQLLPISQNSALFSLLGTTYGGDGRTTFALPDLRSRAPMHVGSSGGVTHSIGQRGGEETVTLSMAEMPAHTHAVSVSADEPNRSTGTNSVLAAAEIWAQPSTLVSMEDGSLTSVGNGQAHQNMQPYTTLNCCIALQGIFPSRN